MASTSNVQTVPSSDLSSSFSESPWEYEVFLSFRGEDTRYTFTERLYEALVDKGIVTFKDDEELEIGKPISPELLSAIEKSRMAVIVLSRNYASSTWCLQELAKIIECMKERGMRVLPIFYHVDPSHVRHQRKTFAKAFAKHEKLLQENAQTWRNALKEVANLSGRHFKDGSESKFIQNFVFQVFSELNDTRTRIYEDEMQSKLVGIEPRVEELNLYINMPSNDVRFIGIYGMGGIGKTTLARVVFDKICYQFQASSFIQNVRKAYNRDDSLNALQEQLLLDMKLKREIDKWNEHKRTNVIRSRLRKKKVLIVLDDVDDMVQLEKLVGKPDWFGLGSRIIITTENNQLLTGYGVKNVYQARKLNASDALQLFRQKASVKTHCEKDLLNLCTDFVNYADGHPLALEVLGSLLSNQTTDFWKAALKRLREDHELPSDRIKKTLRISYDGLRTVEKKLFLDIACFFNGEDKDRVADLLEDPRCEPNFHMKILKDKSLITILGTKLWMHNLLQQMGWEIVHEECSERPGERSRLWLSDDVFKVLKDSTGTNLVEGIMINSPPHQKQDLNAKAFSNMKSIRLLKISKVDLPQGLNYLSNELCLMEWNEYPLRSMPKIFKPVNLVELIMRGSNLKQLQKEFTNLSKLKLIDLSGSQSLIMTPNFSGFPNLKRLIFQGCTRLRVFHTSIGTLNRLTLLNLKDCVSLDRLPPQINLESLEILILSGCSRLEKFSEIGENMTSLLELYLDGTAIEELPLSIKHLTGLTLLNLENCRSFSSFPSIICELTSLKTLNLSGFKCQPPISWQSLGRSLICTLILWTYCFFITQHPESETINFWLPKSFSGLSSLLSLDLSSCNLLDGELRDNLSCFSSLQFLNLSRNNFTLLPDSIHQLSKLKFLYLNKCSRLQSLPYLPLSTQFVMARECTSLENYSNQVTVWTSGEAGFTFINCLGLLDDEECNVSEVSLLDIHFQPLWQRYMEEQCHQSEGFSSVLPQTEIPKWFSFQKTGSSVTIPLPTDLYVNSSWRGLAMCTVFVVDKNLNSSSPGQDSNYFHEFICRLDMDGGLVDSPLVFTVPKEKFNAGSFGLWLYISHARFRDHLDIRNCISPSITTNSPDVVIKLCGARILYEQDMVEFVKNLSQENFGSPDDLRQRHEKFIEYHMNCSQSNVNDTEPCESSGQSDSNSRLKRELKSLLSRLYQVDSTRNHWYDYIFPQSAIPSWFSYQNFRSDVRMELPQNLQDNTAWTGFAVYAFYKLQKQQPAGSGDDQDSVISVVFHTLSAGDEGPRAPYMAFPLSRDIFVGSHRLLVFYIPCVLFRLNRCSHIWASFQSTNSSVEVEMCGIRLVYEQDIEEFVQALVQSMLGCPDAYHEHYYRNLLDQVAMSQGCDHGKDFGCSFNSLQRTPQPVPKLLPSIGNVAEEGCTSPETFSNQVVAAGTSRNSSYSYIHLGIPFGNGQCESTSSISRLESWFRTHLQNYYNKCGIFDHCFPHREIPRWFYHQSHGPSVTLPLPPYLYNNLDWMGFAVCAVFSFHKHPTAVRKNLDSRYPHRVMCHLETNLGCMSPLLQYSITEDEILISLFQRAFIWVSFISRGVLSRDWSQCTWVKFSFVSDSPDASALKCAVDLVYQQNMEEFNRTVVQLIISYIGYVDVIRSSNCEEAIYERLPIYHDKIRGTNSSCEDLDPQWLPISQEVTSGTTRYSYEEDPSPYNHFYGTGALDFCPSAYYNFCFPHNKIQEYWFRHQRRGHSATIDVPSNLYNDNNWNGFVLYACFSIDGDPKTILNNLVSEISHFLYCQLQTSVAGLNDQIDVCRTSREEIMWLFNLGGFIWISYIPGEKCKSMVRQCSHIEASFVSDWPGVMVQKCALRLLYQHDLVQFKQKLKHGNSLISEYRESMRQFVADHEKRNEHRPDNEVGLERTVYPKKDSKVQIFTRRPIHEAETNGTSKSQLGKSDLLDFDGGSVYNSCFLPSEILNWFSHQSNEPTVTIDIPENVCNDSNWMGLFLCAYISVHEHQTNFLRNSISRISHHLICHLETDIAGQELELHVHQTTKEEFMWLYIEGGFLWLSYIPLASFPDNWSNQCSRMEASVISDWPGLMVQKCGLRFFHKHDEEEFEQIIFRCKVVSENRDFIPQVGVGNEKTVEQNFGDEAEPRRTTSFNEDLHHELSRRPIYKGESSGEKKELCNKNPYPKNQRYQSDVPNFDRRLIYNSCFPPSEILEWFSHRSDEPLVTIRLPPNVHNDCTWMGLALCASFSVLDEDSTSIFGNLDSQVPYGLTCHLETDKLGSLESLHNYCLTKEDLMLLKLGGFIWLSYIPCAWFPNWLNQCSQIAASIVTDYPSLMVQKCGFRLLYQNDKVEFKETIRHCMASFSNNWDGIHKLMIDNEKTMKPNLEDEAKLSTSSSSCNEHAHPERLGGSIDPTLKDKGKGVVE